MNISNCLLIHLTTNNFQKFEWIKVIDKSFESDIQSDTLSDIAECSKTNNIIIILPGISTTTTSVNLPTARLSQLQAAIPYALEDQLATDIQQLNFTFIQEDKTKNYTIAITDKNLLTGWLEECNKAHLKPIKMIPEYLAIPIKDNAWTVVVTDDYSLVRTASNKGYAVEKNHLFNLLSQQYIQESDTTKPQKIYFINLTQKEIIFPEDLSLPKEIISTESRNTSICHVFREGLVNSPTHINLLPNTFHFGSSLKKINKIWLIAGCLTFLWISTFIIGNTVSYFYLNHQKKAMQQQVTALYQQLFPEATTIVAPELRVQQELQKIQQQQSDQGLLSLLEKVGKILKVSSNVQFERLSFKNDSLNLTINVPNIQSWKMLQSNFNNEKLKISEVNIKNNNDHIVVVFNITQ